MKTDELIENLSETLEPVPRHWVLRQLLEGVGAGALVSFLILWVSMGFRPDLATAIHTSAYWMKFFYTLALALLGFWATERLARPSSKAGWAFLGIALVIFALTVLSGMQLMHAPAAARMPMIMGHSSRVCPWLIIGLSVPIFAGTFWSLQKLAPTRTVLAGTVAGFASGALGAWIYAFRCDETTAPFLLIFFTLGMAVVGLAGGLVARRVLRW
ncbi:MAG TPA: DUF1109 domain-containing protein [Rhizomicrobium sp.]|nr:DUF1109 domain-containing protein [Rhizomicrobium sp.]